MPAIITTTASTLTTHAPLACAVSSNVQTAASRSTTTTLTPLLVLAKPTAATRSALLAEDL